MNKEALVKYLNEVYNLISDHDITEAMERLEFVISEVKQLHIPVVSGMFSEKQIEEAWTDGCGCGESRSGYFDIENYR